VKSAGTIEALAALIGRRELALSATFEKINASVLNSLPDTMGRQFKRPLEAPFHAIQVTGALFHTQGGLSINDHCQVLKSNGQTLPNLFAAGGAARGVSGSEVWGYLSGNGLLSAIAGGHIAAHAVAPLVQNLAEKI